MYRLLGIVPFLGLLGGVVFVNRVEPLVFGLPLILTWIVFWVILTVLIMALVYRLDPANRGADEAP